MFTRLTATAIIFALGSAPAWADTYSDCLRASSPKLQLHACSAVAGSNVYSAQQRARALRLRGGLHAQAGAHQRAIEDFNSALALLPDDMVALEKRALSLVSLSRYEMAIADLTGLIARKPKVARLLVERGYVYLISDRTDAAISDFSAALAVQPQHAVALNNRGLAYRKKGDLSAARADYTAAIAVAPTYALAYANRGYAYEAEGMKKQAIADLRLALHFNPKLASVAVVLGRLGDRTARSDAEKLLKAGKTIAQTLCSRCHALEPQGDSPNPKAPPFRDIGKRYPLIALREPINRSIAAPHDQMPHFSLQDADVDNLVAFINSLN
ncbi:MAG: tetratricopeptide repeat protein [Alphaproteobacteria bacterium]|nr:tetratricopeptide repeat protein [Alphaproteobacteria bacterium]